MVSLGGVLAPIRAVSPGDSRRVRIPIPKRFARLCAAAAALAGLSEEAYVRQLLEDKLAEVWSLGRRQETPTPTRPDELALILERRAAEVGRAGRGVRHERGA